MLQFLILNSYLYCTQTNQRSPQIGAILVSTPQDLALKDTLKGLALFQKVSVPVLGMVQNMSVFTCPSCSQTTHVFGGSGHSLHHKCAELDVDLLGELPLQASICEDADCGKPSVVAEPNGEAAKIILRVAETVSKRIGL